MHHQGNSQSPPQKSAELIASTILAASISGSGRSHTCRYPCERVNPNEHSCPRQMEGRHSIVGQGRIVVEQGRSKSAGTRGEPAAVKDPLSEKMI
jgi:hypothetical protein